MEPSPSLIIPLHWISFVSESNVKITFLLSCSCHSLAPVKYNKYLQNCDSRTIRNVHVQWCANVVLTQTGVYTLCVPASLADSNLKKRGIFYEHFCLGTFLPKGPTQFNPLNPVNNMEPLWNNMEPWK